MAETDVRALLRAERAARRITHPHASYTSDGKLLCNLCELPIKSEAQWQGHLHSSQHVLRSQRAQEVKDSGRDAPVVNGNGKKRKAESLSDDTPQVAEDGDKRKQVRRKKARGSVRFKDLEDEEVASSRNGESAPDQPQTNEPKMKEPIQEEIPLSNRQDQPVDDAEFLAFERDLAALQSSANQRTALEAAATISAAPVTAEELASQAGEDASTQRGRRDADLEAEKEDAERVLEEEFEEMQGLEERVRKLRERREALRAAESADHAPGVDGSSTLPKLESTVAGDERVNGGEEDEDDDGDDDDEEYDDTWGFGGS